jgi:glc operon protein GlcG
MRTLSTLGHADAERAVTAIRDALIASGRAAVIAVADANGELLALLRLDGAPLASVGIATNKAWTAARERRPSGEIGRAARDPQSGFDIAYYGDPRYLGWGGGLPVLLDGAVVGAVAVSGLSEGDDVELASLGVAALLAGIR